jgi:O-acetyl-ADP-ribose deacetylase (regulator of RNase III)
MIEYVKGDATQPIARPAIIAHVCNDVGVWAKGFVIAVSKRWKTPELVYRKAHKLNLNMVQFIDCDDEIIVANMIAQRSVRGPLPLVRYEALHICLERVAGEALRSGSSIHMPRIGCGLGGGRWEDVAPIIEESCAKVRVVVYDLEKRP